MLNFRHTEDTKEKMRLAWVRRREMGVSQETREKLRLAKIGNKNSAGAKCSFWKGGVSKTNDRIRHSVEYKKWRFEVFQRDNFSCVLCGISGVYLNADHIKPFAFYPELRFSVDNGRTLCVPCHKNTETWGRRSL